MSIPKVSVCVVTYNQESYIAQCLQSIVDQKTDFEFEVIISDDCSTDGTAWIVKEFADKYANITPIFREKNVGASKNFIEVLKMAKGDFIAICEGDDYWIDQNKLQYQISKLEEYSSADICCHPSFVEKDGRLHKNKTSGNCYKTETILSVHDVMIHGGGYISTPSILLRRSVLNELPLWLDSAPICDYFIQVCGALRDGALFLPHVMSVYRCQAKNSWSQRMLDYNNCSAFLDSYIYCLDLFSQHLGSSFDGEIKIAKSRAFYAYSLLALRNKLYKKFKGLIECSWCSTFSFNQAILYYFRFSPRILRVFINLVQHIKA